MTVERSAQETLLAVQAVSKLSLLISSTLDQAGVRLEGNTRSLKKNYRKISETVQPNDPTIYYVEFPFSHVDRQFAHYKWSKGDDCIKYWLTQERGGEIPKPDITDPEEISALDKKFKEEVIDE